MATMISLRGKLRLFTLFLIWIRVLLAIRKVQASNFPGTIEQPQPSTRSDHKEDWWQQQISLSSQSSDDESSSDWEWDEEDGTGEDSNLHSQIGSSEASDGSELVGSEDDDGSTEGGNGVERVEPNGSIITAKDPPPGSRVGSPLKTPINVSSTDDAPIPSQSNQSMARPDLQTPNKPLQTIEKLQQMLDETDYMTTSRRNIQGQVQSNEETHGSEDWDMYDDDFQPEEATATATPQHSLWTSKDRSKYKKQQRMKRIQEEAASANVATPDTRIPQQPPPPPPPPATQHHYPAYLYSDPHRLEEYQKFRIQEQRRLRQQNIPNRSQNMQASNSIEAAFSSDVEDPSDTDDGLGYTLPNLPVYLSDTEGGDSEAEGSGARPSGTGNTVSVANDRTSTATPIQDKLSVNSNVAPSVPQGYVYGPPPPGGWPGSSSHQGYTQQPEYYGPFPPNGVQPQIQKLSHQTEHIHTVPTQYHQQQPNTYGYGLPHSYNPYYYQPLGPPRPYAPRIDSTAARNLQARHAAMAASQGEMVTQYHIPSQTFVTATEDETVQGSTSSVFQVFNSIQQVLTCIVIAATLCYAAVSPRNLPLVEYNQRFYENIWNAVLTVIPPVLVTVLVVDPNENSIHPLLSAFYNAFTFGYVLTFCLEIASATWIRLAVFGWFDRQVFGVAPKVPLLAIPWVLRENNVRLKPITLFAQDFVVSAIICPIIEEFAKLVILQLSVSLPRNFRWIKKKSKSNAKKTKWVAEPISGHSDGNGMASDVTNVNSYISSMLAVSLGLKLADSIRRVCMYTKAADAHKGFYAVFRGIFPIQELCGAVTALGLARRDVLGQKTPLWKLILPSAIIHGMANFRGMKPLFKWNSATPWSEMQLSPNFSTEGATFAQLVAKALPKIMWLVLLCRVAGYCIKNYYMINRQAVKRTTTYAGKHAAFSAELAATEMLKGKKNKIN